jgi:group I intron endonuclease
MALEIDTSCETVLLESSEKVYGLIYLMTNYMTNMKYVGQTVSHRKNKGKYRPFGVIGRFKDHISEAINNTKKKQCSFLNNAIRKYGKEAFVVETLETCRVSELDQLEQTYIKQFNTLSPKGYNLTKGGKTSYEESHLDVSSLNYAKPRGGSKSRSEETRLKMSKRSKELITEECCKERSTSAKNQHYLAKLERFKDCKVDITKEDSYIKKKGECIVVEIGDVKTRFTSKHETLEQIKERARAFIKELSDATLSNCGKPVKPE